MRIEIRNGRVIDPASGMDRAANVFVANGKIVGAGETPPDGFTAEGVIDASGCIVCPGLIDLSARLREPGFEYKATLESEMAAAAAGGVTRLVCPPDTDPPLDEPGLVEMLKYRARQPGFAHVHPLGALTVGLAGQRLTEMAELAEAGCIAFGQADVSVVDTKVLLRAMQYAATFGFPVWLQAQDAHLAKGGVAHDGAIAARLGLAGIPVVAETVALATYLQLARETGGRLHIRRLSSAAGLELVRAARADGLPVTCDITTQHLHLCDRDIGFFNAHARLTPPLRSAKDRAALALGLADGSIDVLCSDHTPVDDDAKQLPFDEAEPGATGLELLLPLTLRWASTAQLPLTTALARITSDPARILGLDCGRIAVGAPADLCVFDPAARFIVSRERLKSQGKNTPFLGQELAGEVRYTLIDGHLAYAAEKLL
ncbi:MAG: dihydroorotase [Gammaproteobacteria bacterium]|nr:dihydroorotase [Rhodocyclaceae bacterium]MBU3910226.1 dihydroorotase [Gammaproteobacteria bacterium]MBU3988812.1 dihydroorotase [Gammaproteobacteria bacterium]MBU4004475.1 dihydroorotase [Gammaproteobacteria bacterium]MBU4022688.1 dihydroorotase [Gammaproteobacteria bacterium]